MANLLHWNEDEFKENYVEAVEEFRLFHNFAADVLRGSSANNDVGDVQESYAKAKTHYMTVVKLLARSTLRFFERTTNQDPVDWDQWEKDVDIQTTALAGMLSRSMNDLLAVHKISLERAQGAELKALRKAKRAS